MPLRIFRLRTLAGANAVGLLLGGSFFAFIFVGTLYMQQVLGYSAIKTGFAWLAASVTSVAFAGLAQALVSKLSAKLVMAFGMGLIGAGILWSTSIPVHGGFWSDLAGPFFVVGAGTAFAFIPVSIAGLAGVSQARSGARVRTAQHVAADRRRDRRRLSIDDRGVAIRDAHRCRYVDTGRSHRWLPVGLWVCGAIGLAAVPIALLLVKDRELAPAIVTSDTAPALASAE